MVAPNGILGSGKIVAVYPSGKVVQLQGTLYFGRIPDQEGASPVVDSADGKIVILDPRARIAVDGVEKYHPRAWPQALLPAWAAQWLEENPTWAEVENLITGDAPGAMPKGTRVRKKTFEDGDGHEIGATGTVAGSIAPPGMEIWYSVYWDDMPAVPVGTVAHKIERCGHE